MVGHYHEPMHPAAHDGPRIAFFGGSFDPPHCGHLTIAHAAQSALALDTVLFAPVGAQPLKPDGSTASFEDRVAMTRLAIANEPAFALSLADAPKPADTSKFNYTYDTLLALKQELPEHTTLFCLMGADSFFALRRWHRGAEIPFIAPLIVASRPGQNLVDLSDALPASLSLDPCSSTQAPGPAVELRTCTLRNASGATAPFHLLPGLYIDISATAIREEVHSEVARIPAGEGHHSDLPDAVFDYIGAHNLYR